ncbi:DUF1876 domain-containing protein [Streptomyces sp. A7024]|uniref:DUF1876 domain-containing protein n=1 Tax=Streptomyces coryli TaxID=1128680 RepID=A0A6G4U6W4_9ACTN|nr:DUF1876 domain-containing protein [Streptomyces coryli]NGN67979.1 DUF1876 domain-containing protein [Streptomyces coryli]
MRNIAGWHIEMDFLEDDYDTRATALLRLSDGTELTAHGGAKRHPSDPGQRLVGEEIAAARALTELARQLLEKASAEIQRATHQQPTLTPRDAPRP